MGRTAVPLFAMLAMAAALGGCAVAQSHPPPPRPLGEIVRQERAVVVSVADTRIDLRTGMGRSVGAHMPAIPVGPYGVRLPVQIGGEKRVEVPAEEITVRLVDGKLILVVQELGSPPFATGERVRVLYERPDETTGVSRIRVVRE